MLSSISPYQVPYDAATDSDVTPSFASIKLKLVHPKTDPGDPDNDTLQSFHEPGEYSNVLA